MSSLAKEVGGSKATLWTHFSSKADLFAAVVEDLSAEFRSGLAAALQDGGDLRARLFHFCQNHLRTAESEEGLATLRLVAAEAARFPEVSLIFHEQVTMFSQTTLGQFLRKHIESGELRSGDPVRMAQVLSSLCAGRQNQLLWGPQSALQISIDQEAQGVADVFLRAYGRSQ